MNRQLNLLTPESTLFETFLIEREKPITVLVTLCGVLAMLLGVGWCLMRIDLFLYPYVGLYLVYLVGQKYWKFRDRNDAEEKEDASCDEISVKEVDDERPEIKREVQAREIWHEFLPELSWGGQVSGGQRQSSCLHRLWRIRLDQK